MNRLPVNFGVTKYPELEGLYGKEYRNAWNKLHRKECREALRRYYRTGKGKAKRKEWHFKLRHSIGRKKNRGRYNVRRNNKSRKVATMSRQLWGPVEDAMLFSGIPQSKLVHELGRSILAIQQRKIRIKKMDAREEKGCSHPERSVKSAAVNLPRCSLSGMR
jgi:hypothetical protein